MAINFPSTPSLNDVHTHSGVSYKWDGSTWKAVGSTATFDGNLSVDLTVDTNVLKVDTSNNQVGIGTATPNSLLHLYQPTDAVYITFGQGQHNTNYWVGTYGTTAGFFIEQGSSNNMLLEADASDYVSLWGAGTKRLETTSTGVTITGDLNVTGNGSYTDSDVDTHLNQSNPTSGHVLSWNGSDYAWTAQTGVTYDLTASGGSVAEEEKILLTGSDSSEDAVTLAVDASSSLTIARANNKITFGGGTYSAGTGLSLSGTTFNVTSTYTSSRTTAAATTSSIADQASANIDITAAKAYALLKIQTSHAAWVTLYTDSTSRTSDASRNITTDPLPGSGVIAEILMSDGGIQKITPGTIGYNDDATPVTTVYAKVQNRNGTAGTVTVTLHFVPLES